MGNQLRIPLSASPQRPLLDHKKEEIPTEAEAKTTKEALKALEERSKELSSSTLDSSRTFSVEAPPVEAPSIGREEEEVKAGETSTAPEEEAEEERGLEEEERDSAISSWIYLTPEQKKKLESWMNKAGLKNLSLNREDQSKMEKCFCFLLIVWEEIKTWFGGGSEKKLVKSVEEFVSSCSDLEDPVFEKMIEILEEKIRDFYLDKETSYLEKRGIRLCKALEKAVQEKSAQGLDKSTPEVKRFAEIADTIGRYFDSKPLEPPKLSARKRVPAEGRVVRKEAAPSEPVPFSFGSEESQLQAQDTLAQMQEALQAIQERAKNQTPEKTEQEVIVFFRKFRGDWSGRESREKREVPLNWQGEPLKLTIADAEKFVAMASEALNARSVLAIEVSEKKAVRFTKQSTVYVVAKDPLIAEKPLQGVYYRPTSNGSSFLEEKKRAEEWMGTLGISALLEREKLRKRGIPSTIFSRGSQEKLELKKVMTALMTNTEELKEEAFEKTVDFLAAKIRRSFFKEGSFRVSPKVDTKQLNLFLASLLKNLEAMKAEKEQGSHEARRLSIFSEAIKPLKDFVETWGF